MVRPSRPREANRAEDYEPPDVTHLGTIAELTQKEVGGADGTVFQDVDIS
jgi:hypothetical protein